MPRQSKGARLYLKPARRNGDTPMWVIRDGRESIPTGCGPNDRAEAEKRLAEYIERKHRPARRDRQLSDVKIHEVLQVYMTNVIPGMASPKAAGGRMERLLEFFGAYTLNDITGQLCRDYAKWREGKGRNAGEGGRIGNGVGGARRDLQDFQAAINYHRKEGFHRAVVAVRLPPAGSSRTRWLSRSEVARLLWVCLTTCEIQDGKPTDKRPLRHLVRFILVAIYTGSRPGAIFGLNWDRTTHRGWVDLQNEIIFRKSDDENVTNKRKTPVPIAPELLRLMRRWVKEDGFRGPVVRFNDEEVQSVKTAFKRAVELAQLGDDVTPYTLRHTTGSWLIQNGVSTRKAAEILGCSEKMIQDHYGHLAPKHLRKEVAMIGNRKNAS